MHAWNSHTLALRGERNRSPRDLWFFGMIQEGPRGLADLVPGEPEMTVEELQEYGIDWNDMENEQLMSHFFAANQQEQLQSNYLQDTHPGVQVDPPVLPLSVELAQFIDNELERRCVSTGM